MKRVLSAVLSLCIILCTVNIVFDSVYALAATQKRSLPFSFEDGSSPISRIDNVYYNGNGYDNYTEEGIGLVTGDDALNGDYSLKIGPIKDGNQRTQSETLQMAANANFSTTDFSKVTGIMMRIKIDDDTSGQSHKLAIALTQNKISKATWLGCNAVAYDKTGKLLSVQSSALDMTLPSSFDGFVFMPLADASSEQVTIEGYYDKYQTYPKHMVNLAKTYSMQLYFNDSSWNKTSVYMDDIGFYSGSGTADHYNQLKELGYEITAVIQPARYNLPMNFEELYNPFISVSNVYDEKEHKESGGVELVSDAEALNGKYSVKYGPFNEKNSRAMSTEVKMKGNPDFSKLDFSAVTGMMLRLKIAGDSGNTAHRFSVALRQDGVSPTWLGRSAVAYDLDGNKIDIKTESLSAYLPAGFDGYLFLPLNESRSETVTEANQYDSYQQHPESMVDLSQDYTMQIYFYDATWNKASAYMDDINYYAGTSDQSHYDLLKALGYTISAVAQPERYSLPMSFEDLYNPFVTVSNVYNGTEHKESSGVALIKDAAVLNGKYSVQYGTFYEKNIRTMSSEVKMTGTPDFSKSDFSKVTGIMMRIKIGGDTGSLTHGFSIALRQDGISKTMWLGHSAVAYDLSGNKVNIVTKQLTADLPAGFDGYIFLPLDEARSEQVTTPGSYDAYQTYPEHMVDLSKDYTLQIYFNDETWNGKTAVLDDINYYGGSTAESHYRLLESLGYAITAIAQPARYSMPLNFDNQYNPFITVSNIYDEAEHLSDKGSVIVSGDEVLNGRYSLRVGPFYEKNSRAMSSEAKMTGNSNFSKTDFSRISGIMMRIKIAGDSGDKKHRFSVALRQDGVAKAMWLGHGTVAYDLNGNKVTVTTEQLAAYLPAGFDGFVFIPLGEARSEQVTTPGSYDTYQTYPEHMVDLSKDYTLQIYFYDDSWQGRTAYIDDIGFFSGTAHAENLALLSQLGYKTSAIAQPDKYSFPLTFDDGMIPFEAVNDVYDNGTHWKNEGVAAVGGSAALCGSTSIKIGNFRADNQRTELNAVNFEPLAGFSKSDFSTTTGIMLRIKANSSANADISFALNQTGLKKRTWLGNEASAYDLAGNPVQLQNRQLSVELPAGFDGYLFLPFKGARSEIVTDVGFYDSYEKHPDSMVDLSKNYTLEIMFEGKGWDNGSAVIDDLRVYSGNQHINILKKLYSGIVTVQQPDCYELPFDFAAGMTPFTPPVDGGLYAQKKGEHGTAGTVSYVNSDIRNRTAMKIDFAADLTDAYSMYTSRAKVQGNDIMKGFALRVKTDCEESATLAIMTDWLSQDSMVFGRNAVLYDMKGNQVDQPMEKYNWLGVGLPANFDGFIFIPYSTGFLEKKNTFGGSIDGWKFSNKQREMQLIFYGEKQWQGKSITIDYFGEFKDTNYVALIEQLGYELDMAPSIYWRDIIGKAKNMFFYNIRLNDSFEIKSLEEMKNWTLMSGKDPNGKSSFSSQNVQLGNNSLILRYKKDGDSYTTGGVKSAEKYTYGYYEATLSMPKLAGTQSVLRLVTDGDFREGGTAFEVNIAYLDDLYKLKTGYRYMKNHIPQKNNGEIVDGEADSGIKDDFANVTHTYGLLYTYDYLRYYVDGELVRVVENTFARGNAYIQISQSVTGKIDETLTEKNAVMCISNVSYWEIDMDEMTKFDTLLEDEQKLLASGGVSADDVEKLPVSGDANRKLSILNLVFGAIDLLGVAFIGLLVIRNKKVRTSGKGAK